MDKQNKKLSPEQQKELESFKKWLEDNKYSPKDEKEVADLYKKYKSQKTKKAGHGAKLNYFRILKHQCAEDEEIVYYKKGGSVDCGCKKKDGGEVTKAEKGTVVDKFKNRKETNQQKNNTGPITQNNPSWKAQKPTKKFKNDYSSKRVKDSEKDYLEGKGDHEVKKCGGKVKKDCGGSKLKACNGAVAKFKAACGSKMKKHQNGGSLNGIPFNLNEKQLLDLYKNGKRGNSMIDQNSLKKFKMKYSRPKFYNIPLYNDSTFQKINPIITPDTRTLTPPLLRYAQNGTKITQDLTELAPIYGTYKAGQRFFRNPTWEGAGDLALSALGDAALISGVGAGAGLAIKGSRAAKTAIKTTKAAKRMYEAEKARRYYDLGNHAVNEGAMLYGGSAAIKAQKK